jgi:hypothetical protein
MMERGRFVVVEGGDRWLVIGPPAHGWAGTECVPWLAGGDV